MSFLANMITQIKIGIAVVLLATSCTRDAAVITRTCSVDYLLCSEVTEFFSFDVIHDALRRAGLKIIPAEGEEQVDFEISVVVTNFPSTEPTGAFCVFEYRIHYKDTLFTVSPEITIHGVVDRERAKFGFEYLNRNLRYVLDEFPKPKVEKRIEKKAQ